MTKFWQYGDKIALGDKFTNGGTGTAEVVAFGIYGGKKDWPYIIFKAYKDSVPEICGMAAFVWTKAARWDTTKFPVGSKWYHPGTGDKVWEIAEDDGRYLPNNECAPVVGGTYVYLNEMLKEPVVEDPCDYKAFPVGRFVEYCGKQYEIISYADYKKGGGKQYNKGMICFKSVSLVDWFRDPKSVKLVSAYPVGTRVKSGYGTFGTVVSAEEYRKHSSYEGGVNRIHWRSDANEYFIDEPSWLTKVEFVWDKVKFPVGSEWDHKSHGPVTVINPEEGNVKFYRERSVAIRCADGWCMDAFEENLTPIKDAWDKVKFPVGSKWHHKKLGNSVVFTVVDPSEGVFYARATEVPVRNETTGCSTGAFPESLEPIMEESPFPVGSLIVNGAGAEGVVISKEEFEKVHSYKLTDTVPYRVTAKNNSFCAVGTIVHDRPGYLKLRFPVGMQVNTGVGICTVIDRKDSSLKDARRAGTVFLKHNRTGAHYHSGGSDLSPVTEIAPDVMAKNMFGDTVRVTDKHRLGYWNYVVIKSANGLLGYKAGETSNCETDQLTII